MGTESQPVLLTGGAGFIGSHVAEALLRRGTQLVVVDNLDNFYSPAWKKANLDAIRRMGAYDFFNLDICDIDPLRELIKKHRPAALIHLAARAGVRPSIEQPLLYEHVNVHGTLNLLELSREFGIARFVFGSSSSVYGATSRAPFSEDQVELRPISPYAATKLAGELLAYTYAHLFQLEVVSLRFFTVYGPRQRPDLAIHKFTALIERGKALPIFGDGAAGRDYTYVDDIVSGVLSGLDYKFPAETGARFEVFNLGNSHPIKLTELVEEIERATSKTALRESRPSQPGDVPLTWADTRKAERLLGYRPATPLRKGLRQFVEWYRSTDSNLRA
jgi:UDP-glucuronate 4-epimerase